ncbi:putative integral membrane protein [Cryptosporidium felis]|nr:putative integral membrane protein [Cryptosporidium felis]
MDQAEILRKQAEIRKRKVLERSSERLRLIYPNFEEEPSDSGSADLRTEDALGTNKRVYSNLSRASTDSTFHSREKLITTENFSDKCPEEDSFETTFSKELEVTGFLELWGTRKSRVSKRLGSSFLGATLFILHSFVPSNFGIFGIRPSSISGILSFLLFQLAFSLMIVCSQMLNYFSLDRARKDLGWGHFIFGSKGLRRQKHNLFVYNTLQQISVAKSVTSDWFLLVTVYFFLNALYNWD